MDNKEMVNLALILGHLDTLMDKGDYANTHHALLEIKAALECHSDGESVTVGNKELYFWKAALVRLGRFGITPEGLIGPNWQD